MPTTRQPSDPPRRFVELPTGPVAYTDEGAGPGILLAHGLPGSVRDFRWLAPELSRFARVIRIDLPGFGESPLTTQPDLSPLARAGVITQCARALDLHRPLLVGHSMGGILAVAAATLDADAFAGVALLSTPGLRPHQMLRRVPFRLLSRLTASSTREAILRPIVRRFFALGGFRGYADAELTRTFHCLAQLSMPQHTARVLSLAVPTMVVYCEDDPIIDAVIARDLADACPTGPRLRFERGGHNPQKTHAAEISSAVERWLPTLVANRRA